MSPFVLSSFRTKSLAQPRAQMRNPVSFFRTKPDYGFNFLSSRKHAPKRKFLRNDELIEVAGAYAE